MGGGTGTGGEAGAVFLRFPDINPDDKAAVDDYYTFVIDQAITRKAYTAMQRNFESDQGRVLDVFNGGRHIGFIDESDGAYDVYVDVDSETGGRALNRDSLPFEAAAKLMHSYVTGEYVEPTQETVNPNVGLGFGLDIDN